TELQARQADYAYVYNRTSIPMKLVRNSGADLAAMAATMIRAEIPPQVYSVASSGIARDLRMILQESMRVAAENGIDTLDARSFSGIIESVSKKLGRKIVKQ
ncbi:MAG TPA: hypothetical protein PLR69_08305, partial [Candidatus Limiplasma sp.]|nr:hypothetical protein [Candidatus Limiplasma sp.]